MEDSEDSEREELEGVAKFLSEPIPFDLPASEPVPSAVVTEQLQVVAHLLTAIEAQLDELPSDEAREAATAGVIGMFARTNALVDSGVISAAGLNRLYLHLLAPQTDEAAPQADDDQGMPDIEYGTEEEHQARLAAIDAAGEPPKADAEPAMGKKDKDKAAFDHQCSSLLSCRLENSAIMDEHLREEELVCCLCRTADGAVLCHCLSAAGSALCPACDVSKHCDSGVPCTARYCLDRSVVHGGVLRRLEANEFVVDGAVVWRYLPIFRRPAEGCPHCGSHRLSPTAWQREKGSGKAGDNSAVTVSSLLACHTYEGQYVSEVLCGRCGRHHAIQRSSRFLYPSALLPTSTGPNPRSLVDVASLEVYSALEDASLTGLSPVALEKAFAAVAPWAATVGYAVLRGLLMCFRLLCTVLLPAIGGAKHQCITCGPSCWGITTDGCWKCQNLKSVSGPTHDLSMPGGLLFPTNAMAAIEKAASVVGPPLKDEGKCGTTSHTAARSQETLNKSDVTHFQAATCRHNGVWSGYLSLQRETFAAHAVQSLLALFAGARFHSLDVYCQAMRSWVAQARIRGPGFLTPAAQLLCPDIARLDVAAPSVVDSPGPKTTYTLARRDPVTPQPINPDFVMTPLGRVAVGARWLLPEGAEGSTTATVNGVIPAVHAYVHKCMRWLGARAVYGAANANEFCEQLFAWLAHRFVRMKNMSRTTMAQFLEYTLAAYNANLNTTAPARLLAALLKALKKRYYQTRPALLRERAALGALAARVDSHAKVAELLRLRVARDNAPSKGDDRSAAVVRRMTLDAHIAALKACLPRDSLPGELPMAPVLQDLAFAELCEVNAGAGAAMGRRARLVATGAARVRELQEERDKLVHVAARTPVDALKTHLDSLHRMAATLAGLRAAVAAPNSTGLKSGNLKARIAATYSEAAGTLPVLVAIKAILRGNPAHAQLTAWVLPTDGSALLAPGALPSTLDGFHFGDLRDPLDAFLDAYCENARAIEGLANARADVTRTIANIEVVLQRLHAQLASLCSPSPDLVAGSAGVLFAAGTPPPIVGTEADAPPSFALLASISPSRASSGLACGTTADIRRLHSQLLELRNLRDGVALLPVDGDDTPAPARARDAKGVRLMLQYGGVQLLSGSWSAERWSALWGTHPVTSSPDDDAMGDDGGAAEVDADAMAAADANADAAEEDEDAERAGTEGLEGEGESEGETD